jgi:hypothetical protein
MSEGPVHRTLPQLHRLCLMLSTQQHHQTARLYRGIQFVCSHHMQLLEAAACFCCHGPAHRASASQAWHCTATLAAVQGHSQRHWLPAAAPHKGPAAELRHVGSAAVAAAVGPAAVPQIVPEQHLQVASSSKSNSAAFDAATGQQWHCAAALQCHRSCQSSAEHVR